MVCCCYGNCGKLDLFVFEKLSVSFTLNFGEQIVYGLSFDLSVEEEDNTDNANWDLYDSGCWNTSLQLRIENELSIGYFGEEFQEREEANSSSYGGSDAGSWLLSLGQSLLLSMILWQPLNV